MSNDRVWRTLTSTTLPLGQTFRSPRAIFCTRVLVLLIDHRATLFLARLLFQTHLLLVCFKSTSHAATHASMLM